MKIYEGENIRNVALVGHGDTGKTQLVSALLYTAGMANTAGQGGRRNLRHRLRRRRDPAQFLHQRLACLRGVGKTKINFIDTPGYNIFIHETEAAMWRRIALWCWFMGCRHRSPDRKGLELLRQVQSAARAVVINQMDRDRASFERVLGGLQAAYGRAVIPCNCPSARRKIFGALLTWYR